jgi:arsenate reductase
MGEALLRHLSGGRIEVVSAGSDPKAEIHPLARRVMRDLFGLDLAGQRPKSVDSFAGQTFDFVISVCDRAADSCPVFPGPSEGIRWSLDDPAAVEGAEEERVRAFAKTAGDLMARIRTWLLLPAVSSRLLP